MEIPLSVMFPWYEARLLDHFKNYSESLTKLISHKQATDPEAKLIAL